MRGACGAAEYPALAVRPTESGVSGVPLLRSDWYGDGHTRRNAAPVSDTVAVAPHEPAPTH